MRLLDADLGGWCRSRCFFGGKRPSGLERFCKTVAPLHLFRTVAIGVHVTPFRLVSSTTHDAEFVGVNTANHTVHLPTQSGHAFDNLELLNREVGNLVCPCDTHLFMSVLACLHNYKINSNTLMPSSQFNLTRRARVCSARGGRTNGRSSARCQRQRRP